MTSRTKNFCATAGAALAVFGVIGAASWVTWSAGTDLEPRDSSDAVSSTLGEAQPWEARADQVFESWAGTSEERQAAEAVIAYRLNGAFGRCMEERGYSRPWQDSMVPPSVQPDPLIYSLWAAGPMHGYYAQKVTNGEEGQRIERASSYHAVGEEEDAELACRKDNPAAGDDEVSAIRNPQVVAQVERAWAKALEPVVVAGGSPDDYEQCVADSGVLSEMGVKTTQDARDSLSQILPLGAVPLGDELATEAWKNYLSQERQFVEADWSCRETQRAGLGEEVEEALNHFEAHQKDLISKARAHWTGVMEEALELGWKID